MTKEEQQQRDQILLDQIELSRAAEPLIKLLCRKHHPHVTAIVTGTSIELMEGIMTIPKIYDYLTDLKIKNMTEEQQEWFDKMTQALDKMSEQGIRRVLYSIIKNYPDECQIVIDAMILKQHKIIK